MVVKAARESENKRKNREKHGKHDLVIEYINKVFKVRFENFSISL